LDIKTPVRNTNRQEGIRCSGAICSRRLTCVDLQWRRWQDARRRHESQNGPVQELDPATTKAADRKFRGFFTQMFLGVVFKTNKFAAWPHVSLHLLLPPLRVLAALWNIQSAVAANAQFAKTLK
jgi:hypothetical protein